MLRLPLDEVSVKVRTGGPIDDEEDMSVPAWTGVIEMATVYRAPSDAPAYAANYARPSRAN